MIKKNRNCIQYIFKDANIVHSIDAKFGENTKTGLGNTMINTYHFSTDQITNNSFELDAKNCLDCPLSYTSGHKLGKCYTHKGLMLMGLKSKLRSLHRVNKLGKIKGFDLLEFSTFLAHVQRKFKTIELCRFGAYGEPTLLNVNIIQALKKFSKTHTGYSHTWRKEAKHMPFLMASVHTEKEREQANALGYRVFFVANEVSDLKNAILCPASKESGNKTTCAKCGLCGGTEGKKVTKDIYINMH